MPYRQFSPSLFTLVRHRTDETEIRYLIGGEDCTSTVGNPKQVNSFVQRQHTEVKRVYQEQCLLSIAGKSARGEVAWLAPICPKKRIRMNQRQDIQSI